MSRIVVTILGRIVEGTSLEVDVEDYYLNNDTKEDAIQDLKLDLERQFDRDWCQSFDGHDDADYLLEEFPEELDKYDWTIPLEKREPSEN